MKTGVLPSSRHVPRSKTFGIRGFWPEIGYAAEFSAYPMMLEGYAVAVDAIFSSFVRFPLRIWIFWSLVSVE